MFGKQQDQPAQEAADDAPDKPAGEAPAIESSSSDQSSETGSATSASVVKPDPAEPAADAPEPGKTTDQAGSPLPADSRDEPTWQHPGTPLDNENGNEQISDIISPAGGYPTRPSYQYITAGAGPGGSPGPSGNDDASVHELIDIKQQALGELAPLIDMLDLPPEEKFHAIMMVIQASDDQDLVKAAYTAAHSIEDEKTRGQALLDLVNEINYFTQQPETEAKPETS